MITGSKAMRGRATNSGALYWKEWGAGYLPAPTNNVAGLYQEFGSAPGSVYQASGWFYTSPNDTIGTDCTAWIDVSFLDAGGKLLALYTSADFFRQYGDGGLVPISGDQPVQSRVSGFHRRSLFHQLCGDRVGGAVGRARPGQPRRSGASDWRTFRWARKAVPVILTMPRWSRTPACCRCHVIGNISLVEHDFRPARQRPQL